MVERAIEISKLGKVYKLGNHSRFGRNSGGALRALDSVDLTIDSGEVVGLVGRNGAGKSTLLKILCRITQPSSGSIILRGRVAGLLEVGTGFHPELTGRENVFLNGTLMGMSRREIRSQFDQIVDFAGTERFLDTPVKRYSSGMYVRLAFAIAAHLRNEVLILDEVLAVGDASFQAKCLEKIDNLARGEGRTVLLVSHNSSVISEYASRAILLSAGRVEATGEVDEILRMYGESSLVGVNVANLVRLDPNWGQVVRITAFRFVGNNRFEVGSDVAYEVEVDILEDIEFGIGQAFTVGDGRPISISFGTIEPRTAGSHVFQVKVGSSNLAPGIYNMNVVIGLATFAAPDLHFDGLIQAGSFEIYANRKSELVDWKTEWWGSFIMPTPRVEQIA